MRQKIGAFCGVLQCSVAYCSSMIARGSRRTCASPKPPYLLFACYVKACERHDEELHDKGIARGHFRATITEV